MADQFPSFSLGFSLDPDIFFDLENENENELLASVNLESPVGNSTNCTAMEGEISVQVTDQNTEPESNNTTNNQRFVNKSSAILVPRGRDPSGLRQESRPLAASKTGSPRFTDSLSNMTNLIG